MPPKPDFAAKMSSAVIAELLLVLAAGVVGDHPVDVAGKHVLPQGLDVLARAQRRVDLAAQAVGGVDVRQQVTDRHLPAEVDVRERFGHLHRGLRAPWPSVRCSRLMLGRPVSSARKEAMVTARPSECGGREAL